MTENEIKDYLEGLEKILFDEENINPILLSKQWADGFESDFNDAGVYVIFEQGKPCYVGETGNIRKRMNDIRNTLNHSMRRNFGHKYFENHPDFYKSSSKRKFHTNIEELLNELMRSKLQVSVLRVNLGRKELEEHICKKYKLLEGYNLRSKRKP